LCGALSPALRLALTAPLGAVVYIATFWLVARDRAREMLSFMRNLAGRPAPAVGS